MPYSFLAFSVATFLPVPFLLISALFGGAASIWALLYIIAIMPIVDVMLQKFGQPGAEEEIEDADLLSQALAFVHFVLLFATVWSLAGHSNSLFSFTGLALFLATGMFLGQVSNSNAHELIHRGPRLLRLMGRWIYISLLFGHHSSAHPLVHHVHVATPNDPNTARFGESFYRYFPRAWLGAFHAGLEVEKRRLTQKDLPEWHWSNPYISYIGGAIAMLAVSAWLAGPLGVLIHLALAFHAQWQLMMSDYVQHYGLKRQTRADGSYEPVNIRHSWNAPHILSSLWMLNAPRHSDHHANPAKGYAELRLPSEGSAPMLPYSLTVMGSIALSPRLWRKVMHPRLAKWQAQEDRLRAVA